MMTGPKTSISPIRRATNLSLAVLLLLVGAAAVHARRAVDDRNTEQWYVVEANDVPAGWMHVSQRTDDDRITTRVQWRLTISRGSHPVSTERSGRFVETVDGKPILLEVTEKSGLAEHTTTWNYKLDGIEMTRAGSAQGPTHLDPPDGPWLTPARLAVQLAAKLADSSQGFSFRHVDILGDCNPVTTRYLLENDSVEIKARTGRTYQATQWRVTQDGMDGIESTEFLDKDGLLIQSRSRIGAITLTTTLATAQQAGRHVVGPDLLGRSFVRPDRRIANPRSLKRLVIDVAINGEADWPEFPQTGVQRVQKTDDARRRRIVIDLDPDWPAVENQAPGPELLEATAMLQSGDELVKRLADRAVQHEPGSDAQRAEAIRAFVQRYVRNKSLDVGFASAAEVAKTRQGDCTEHAVLTAAMLRAVGIPSRIATGLIDTSSFAGQRDIFAYHMWTQAWADGRWIDLDATQPKAFDAAHLALSISNFDDAEYSHDVAAIVPLIGRISINVIETK